jgi:CheY-like chemotaxis protein
VTVASATEAAKVLTRLRFDLVITDILMPDGDGLQLINEFKAAQPQVRIVAISGGGRYMDSNDCLKIARGFGAHAAIMKPFDRKQFMEAIASALAPVAKA